MAGTLSSGSVSTRLQRIAELARERPEMVFTSLSHVIDIDFLEEAYRRTRKDGAVGVDGQTAEEYAADLRGEPAVAAGPLQGRHVPGAAGAAGAHPEGTGQRAGRSASRPSRTRCCSGRWRWCWRRSTSRTFWTARGVSDRGDRRTRRWRSCGTALMELHGGWVLEVDIQRFFDKLEPSHLRSFLDQRVRDGVLRRTIDKWLKAGVLEDGKVRHPELGTPQGGVISPILANIYLHDVLDVWFEDVVKPRMKGAAFLVRYADDAVMVFAMETDARRVMDVLPKRFGKYGLRLHPEKTRLIPFHRPRLYGGSNGPNGKDGPGAFDFLGFTHHWCRTLHAGGWALRRKTARSRFTRGLKRITEWCRKHRHDPVAEQHETLERKLKGHYAYYGLPWTGEILSRFRHEVMLIWWKWLNRRSQRGYMRWDIFEKLLKRYPLPEPVMTRTAPRSSQRTRDPRSRMR